MDKQSLEWIDHLHPKRQKEFLELEAEQQSFILSRSERTRHTALRALIDQHYGWNGRERWVLGLEHAKAFLRHPSHFWRLAFDGNIQGMEAFWDLLINFEMGLYQHTEKTDPLIFDLLTRTYAKFQQHGLHSLDPLILAQYFHQHPERRPRPNQPDTQTDSKNSNENTANPLYTFSTKAK